ncbi:hypothetical protein WBK31_25210 [Nonomuraea sp. N2-4H]
MIEESNFEDEREPEEYCALFQMAMFAVERGGEDDADVRPDGPSPAA